MDRNDRSNRLSIISHGTTLTPPVGHQRISIRCLAWFAVLLFVGLSLASVQVSLLVQGDDNIAESSSSSAPIPSQPSSDPLGDNNANKNNNNTTSSNRQQHRLNELQASEALESIRSWTVRFGSDIHYGTLEANCLRSLRDQYDPARIDPARRANYKASIVSIDWTRTHADIVKTISSTMRWHEMAVEAIARASESLMGNHTFDENLRVDYVDVHRLHDENDEDTDNSLMSSISSSSSSSSTSLSELAGQELAENQETAQLDSEGRLVNTGAQGPPPPPMDRPAVTPAALTMANYNNLHEDEDNNNTNTNNNQQIGGPEEDNQGEWQTPVRYLRLSRHPNFDVPINTEESAVHVPVHIFPGDPVVMNGIAWSQELTRVFRDNFVRNPRLTNQYFASQTGFMRLFPAQKWQIPRSDPDLYDGRMRPWYVGAASSRKDIVILVDSSGSMTGSRRDIAKGVVFEILDTLTENDHFLILKFNDIVQQVGVPSCDGMRVGRDKLAGGSVPLKNTMFHPDSLGASPGTGAGANYQAQPAGGSNGTDVDSLYLLPANGRNVRYIKTNFTIPTSGIANFSHALVTAFEVLRKYQEAKQMGSQCNQAIMLITDGSPSDFADIFDRYNYPNAPVRVFTYLIGREAGDGSHTKMMACHNRGFYTHVINLAEVRETIQQYIPVMARPLVLNRTHPITWTPAYAELTYQVLTDWIWESRRRERARAILAASGRGANSSPATGYVPDIRVTNDDGRANELSEVGGGGGGGGQSELGGDSSSLDADIESLDLFGYQSNPDCFWETRRNDLLTTVVQPVYDTKNESLVVEKYLNKNVWFKKSTVMRTANLLGVAAADMKINDIIRLAPSHRLGANAYAILLTNNGLAMHHPDLRSILEPFSAEPSERNSRILKPFFSSLDFTQVEHILNQAADGDLVALRQEAVAGLTGWRELLTKRTLDCQRRVQSRRQSFYYKPLAHFPFSFMVAVPQPYGSHRIEAQIEIKSLALPEKLTTYFTTSDFDLWTVHPEYQYCDGPSNNTITTLLDMLQRVQDNRLDDVQWRAAESSKPPVFLPGKIICDKDLVQSLVYDAVATFGFAEICGPPSPANESSLLGMFGIRFSFVATRAGLTRVRHYDSEDNLVKREALAFAKRHARAVDETFYSRTVDFNMLHNESATLIQVPFNTHLKISQLLGDYERNMFEDSAEEPGPGYSTTMDASAGAGQEASTSPTDPSATLPTDWPSSAAEQPFGGGGGGGLSIKSMDLMDKLKILTNTSLHVIATQSIIVNEGKQRAVAGVTGAFYDYSSFVIRLLNSTNYQYETEASAATGDGARPSSKKIAACFKDNPTDESCDTRRSQIRCGLANDTIDCLLIDNNGYIIVSEDLDFIGRHLRTYEPAIMSRLVDLGLFHEINVTDYQSICMRQEEKQSPAHSVKSSSTRLLAAMSCNGLVTLWASIMANTLVALGYLGTVLATMFSLLVEYASGQQGQPMNSVRFLQQQPLMSLIPNKTYLRPCERILTRYETRPGFQVSSERPEYISTQCDCRAWFVYEPVPKTNLIMLIVDTTPACRYGCNNADSINLRPESLDDSLNTQYNIIGTNEEKVCSMLERESKLYRKRLDSCFSHHPEEEQIKLCGSAHGIKPISSALLIVMIMMISHAMRNIF